MQHSGRCSENPSSQEVDLFKQESENKSVFSTYWDFSREYTVRAWMGVTGLTSVGAQWCWCYLLWKILTEENGNISIPLQPELGFLLYRCSCKIEKITDLMRDAVFISPEGDVNVLGVVLPAEWHLTGTTGSCDDFSTSPCTKKRDAVLQGATEAWWMKCPSPIPPLGTELAGSCTKKLQTNNNNNNNQTKTKTNHHHHQTNNPTTQTNQTNQKNPKANKQRNHQNQIWGWISLHKVSSSYWSQLNPTHCVVWLFLRVLSY